jgi:hypothetical protein
MKRGDVWRRNGKYYAVVWADHREAVVYSGTTGVDINVLVEQFVNTEKYPARLVRTKLSLREARDRADLLSGCGGRVLERARRTDQFMKLREGHESLSEEERCQREVRRKASKLGKLQRERHKSSGKSSRRKGRQRRSRSI